MSIASMWTSVDTAIVMVVVLIGTLVPLYQYLRRDI